MTPCARPGRATASANRTGPRTWRDPVLRRRQLRRRRRSPGQRGDDRDRAARRKSRPSATVAELVEHRVHQRGVERVADAQPLGPAARAPANCGGDASRRPPRRRRRTTDDGPVDRGDAAPVLGRRATAATSSSAACDRDHRAARGQRLHQPAAGGDQRARVRQGQHPGDVRGGELADRVPGEAVRPYAPATRAAGTARPRPRTAPAG